MKVFFTYWAVFLCGRKAQKLRHWVKGENMINAVSVFSSLSFLSRCTFVPERQVRLEAVRELFLSAYSSTVGLKSSSPSPSGAISGLLEQFARGVGLRGTNAIIWAFLCCTHHFHSALVHTLRTFHVIVYFPPTAPWCGTISTTSGVPHLLV